MRSTLTARSSATIRLVRPSMGGATGTSAPSHFQHSHFHSEINFPPPALEETSASPEFTELVPLVPHYLTLHSLHTCAATGP